MLTIFRELQGAKTKAAEGNAELSQRITDEANAREALDKDAAKADAQLYTKVNSLEDNLTDELSKANNRLDDLGRTTADELSKTRTELGKTETKVSGLETELGKRVTMPVAGGLAAIGGLVGAGLSYFGLKPTIDKAVTDAIKASNTTTTAEDSKKKKAMV